MNSSWLNPRRRKLVERFIDFLKWDGTKTYMDGVAYAGLRSREMQAYQVDQAMDDAHALGLIEMHLAGDDTVVVKLLSDDIDSASMRALPIDPVRLVPTQARGRA